MPNMDSLLSPYAYINNLISTEVGRSNVHGYGLFASCNISSGFVLGDLDGQIMTWDCYHKLKRMANFLNSDELNFFFMEWNCIASDMLLVRPLRTSYSLINHSRTPNLEIRYSPIRVVATRDIFNGEELFLDYRKEPLPQEYFEKGDNNYL